MIDVDVGVGVWARILSIPPERKEAISKRRNNMFLTRAA
jgi:hypothetical protein